MHYNWGEMTSNFPGEGNETYEYRGDGKRHSRTEGGVTTKYGWDMGWNMIHEALWDEASEDWVLETSHLKKEDNGQANYW